MSDFVGYGCGALRAPRIPIRKLAVAATDDGLLAPEPAAGIARVKSGKYIGVPASNRLSLKQSQALLNALDITTTKGLRDRHHRRAPRLSPAPLRVGAPTDGRCSGGFTPGATGRRTAR